MSGKIVQILLFWIVACGLSAQENSYLLFDLGGSPEGRVPNYLGIYSVKGSKKSIFKNSGHTTAHGSDIVTAGEDIHVPLEGLVTLIPLEPGDYIVSHIDFGEDLEQTEESVHFPTIRISARQNRFFYLSGHSFSEKGFDRYITEKLVTVLCDRYAAELAGSRLDLIRAKGGSKRIKEPCSRADKIDA